VLRDSQKEITKFAKSQIPLRYLVQSWSATGFEPDSVTEFGFNLAGV